MTEVGQDDVEEQVCGHVKAKSAKVEKFSHEMNVCHNGEVLKLYVHVEVESSNDGQGVYHDAVV